MAISNRDRVGKMFELLAPPLDEFISRVGRAAAERGCLVDGRSWQLKDEKKGVDGQGVPPPRSAGAAADAHREHPAATSSRAGIRSTTRSAASGRGTAKELREARNDWAHNKSFSDDDAYRCLDTAERLLDLDRRAVGRR